MNRRRLLFLLALAAPGALGVAGAADMAGAQSLFDAGKYPEAQRAFEGLVAADPSNADAHYYLGQLALERDDAGKATGELEKAVELAPESARIHEALGDAYGRSAQKAGVFASLGLARKCHAEYERAAAMEPRNVEFHERLFEYYSQAPSILGGGSDKAAAEAAAIERLDPIRGRQTYAALYIADAKYDLALAELDENLKAAPGDYASLYQVGRLAAISGQHLERGLASLRQCLRLEAPKGAPDHTAVQWRLGNILEKKGDPAGARAAYVAALALDPKFTPASDALRALEGGHGGG